VGPDLEAVVRSGVVAWLSLVSAAGVVQAQDLLPGAYIPAPVHFNVITATTAVSFGDLSFDPALPVEEGRARIGAVAGVFTRTLPIAGRFASVGVAMPFMRGHVEGLLRGVPQEATRLGQADLSGRIAINVYGARAMTLKEFASYRQSTVLGVSFVVRAPTGQYDSFRYINIGTNRWSFAPEVGVSRRRGRWTLEGNLGTTIFADNDDYFGGTRAQSSIIGVQGHLVYTWRPGLWLAGDANFWKGGRITANGIASPVEQKNSRVGLTVAVPVRSHQFRVAYSLGAYTTIGGDFNSIGLSYSYAWRAGR
jgi:hypothetical protein